MAQRMNETVRNAASDVGVDDEDVAEMQKNSVWPRISGPVLYAISGTAGFLFGILLSQLHWQQMISSYPFAAAPIATMGATGGMQGRKVIIRGTIALLCFVIGFFVFLPSFTIGIGYGVFSRNP